ncbi:MAG: protein-disulfide reductase DsbD domain-containing protein [Candidatus Kapaibacteriota bacterium]
MKNYFILLAFLFLILLPFQLISLKKESYKDKRIRIEILSSQPTISKDDTLVFAVKITLAKGWHIYWVNPGDAGEPTILEISSNVDNNKIVPLFPVPSYKNTASIVTLEYHNVVYFPFQIFVPPSFQSDTLAINLFARWLVCREKCVPGTTKLSLKLPFSTTLAAHLVDEKIIDNLKNFPKDSLPARIEFFEEYANLKVHIIENKSIQSLFFYPITEGLFNLEQKPDFSFAGNELLIKLPLLQYVWGEKSNVEGLLEILYTDKKKQYFWLKVVN